MVDPIPFTDLYQSGRVDVPGQAAHVSVSGIIDLSAASAYLLDFAIINQKAVIGLIRSMFLDNSDNPSEVVITVDGTNQRFTIPGNFQGYVPVTAVDSTKLVISSDGGGNPKTPITFYSWAQPPILWSKFGNASGDHVNVQGTMQAGDTINVAPYNKPIYIGASKAGVFQPLQLDANDGLYTAAKNGADVTQGAIADAAYVSGSGTVVSILKGIFGLNNLTLTATGAVGDAAYVSGNGTLVSILKGIFGRLLPGTSKLTPSYANTGPDYETVAASVTNQVLGTTGAIGDILAGILIVPGTTSPGAVAIGDGVAPNITIFTGGATSVGSLVPFFVPLNGAKSVTGSWRVTTGANVTAIGVGAFT